MVPLQMLYCPLAVITITVLYAAWHRLAIARGGPQTVLRERVAYMLWVAASRG